MSAKFDFVKMHGLSNDFIIFDGRNGRSTPTKTQMAKMSHRKTGIGCDQFAIIRDPKEPDTDCFMNIYNAPDATEPEACGNVTRCVAWLLMKENNSTTCTIQTVADKLKCARENVGDTIITVDFGVPKFGWQDIPLSKEIDTLHLGIGEGEVKDPVGVNVGNPHAVFFCEDCEKLDVPKIGPRFETDPLFPRKANIEFATVIDRNTVRMRVWERDTGETAACGSAAFATHVAAVRRGLIDRTADIILDGGTLSFYWGEEDDRCFMSGETAFVFAGSIKADNI